MTGAVLSSSHQDQKQAKASRIHAAGEAVRLVLASASPRRLDLLRQIGLEPDLVDPPHTDEAVRRGELPRDYAKRVASEKLQAAAIRHAGAVVVAADTVVACGRRILPKAEDEATARQCLQLLSGRRHRVLGGIAVSLPDGRHLLRVVSTTVIFKQLSAPEIARYLASQEWHGKAGGYAIQGRGAVFVRGIIGSYSNVVGLSLPDLAAMLQGNDIDW
jgi:septum formation protein